MTSRALMPVSITQQVLIHVPGYACEIADQLEDWARTSVRFCSETVSLFGRAVAVPREVAWFGEPGWRYAYSGTPHVATGWPAALDKLRHQLYCDHGYQPDFVLLNRYRDGKDSMGWHADDEPETRGLVASFSIGATRTLRWRRGRSGSSHALRLAHGDLLVHDRGLYHAVPKTRRPVGERLNLSFRQLLAP